MTRLMAKPEKGLVAVAVKLYREDDRPMITALAPSAAPNTLIGVLTVVVAKLFNASISSINKNVRLHRPFRDAKNDALLLFMIRPLFRVVNAARS